MKFGESENFLRGREKRESKKRKFGSSVSNFERESRAKKRRKPKHEMEGNDLWQSSLKVPSSLSYKEMQAGMVILSCVRHISNFAIQIEFPGLRFGSVGIDQISDLFTQRLERSLDSTSAESLSEHIQTIIRVGDFMPAKIVNVEKNDKGFQVHATVNPRYINSERKHNSFRTGALIWANIISELDHGYELTVGIENCRIFLPLNNTDVHTKYEIGKPLYCIVLDVENSVFATTLTVSAKIEDIEHCISNEDLNLNNVLPGTKVSFFVEEVSTHGVKGRILDSYVGYIHEAEVNYPSSVDLKNGTYIDAYVLFLESITKVTYLTLRGLQRASEPEYEVGKVMSAKILTSANRGLYLQLGKKCLGFVTNKRLLKTLSSGAQFDLYEAIKKKYPLGSSNDCRILDYNYMQHLYICTFEKQVVMEKIFNGGDLTLAQNVNVKIENITANGLVVRTGRVQGFVPNLHVSDAKYSDRIKAKFVNGMTVDTRVLNRTNEDNIIFTFKQGLVNAEDRKCLTKLEDVTYNSQYVGFVVQTKISGALIAFYGNIVGWLSNKSLNDAHSGSYTDPRDYFFVGQVVTVWVIGIKNNKLQLSMTCPKINNKKINLGEIAKGTITAISPDSLHLLVGQQRTNAVIPLAHLSSDIRLCSVLIKTYQLGDEIEDFICIRNLSTPYIFSRRECLAHKQNILTVYKFRDLKKNMFLRCSFENNSEAGIFVSSAIVDYQEKIFIPYNNFSQNGASSSYFQKQELVLANILNVEHNPRKLELSVCTPQSSKMDTKCLLTTLVTTLEEVEHITGMYAKTNAKLTTYKIGERINCTIQSVNTDGSCSVLLPNKVKGYIPSHLCPRTFSSGLEVEAVVLDYDYLDDKIILCCRSSVMQKINKIQGGIIKKSFYSTCMAKLLLFSKLYAVGVLIDSQCNRQLVYLPSEFSCKGSVTYENDKLKIVICRRVGTRIIGLPKKYMSHDEIVRDEKIVCVKRQLEGVDIVHKSNEENRLKKSEDNSDTDTYSKICLPETRNMLIYDGCDEKKSVLSGSGLFYNIEKKTEEDQFSSSDEDDEQRSYKQKKKLKTLQRCEAIKKGEQQTAITEKELLDTPPQNAEQFERLVLTNPNSSKIWLQYMSMHIANTELEKARVVGKRALDSINFTLTEEKFNIWVALLNLENLYGNNESFNEIFEKAVKYNDSSAIYLSTIQILASSDKLTEMEEKIKKILPKIKDDVSMWIQIGKIYYSLQKFKEARNIRDTALKSFKHNKKQFDLILRFAIMEFQLGDLDQAIANFEALIDAYPKKVNIWTIYVDHLIKRDKIDSAKKVLERAIGQKFGLKMMKVLYQKYITFEEKYGSPETIAYIKAQAKEYVKHTSL